MVCVIHGVVPKPLCLNCGGCRVLYFLMMNINNIKNKSMIIFFS